MATKTSTKPKETKVIPYEEIPSSIKKLALWFVEGVNKEIEFLGKNGGTQQYELLSGRFIGSLNSNQAILEFVIADGTRIPEDASGKLKTELNEYPASVVSQYANKIHIQIDCIDIPDSGIQRALLIIDDTAILRKLAEALEVINEEPSAVGSLATTVFRPNQATVGVSKLPQSLGDVKGQVRKTIEQACGSTVTYIWGPPGTGKTYTIANLVMALMEQGERVLVTSHTHAAVDQALNETLSLIRNIDGHILDKTILRVGITSDPKIPDTVKLQHWIDIESRDIRSQIIELEKKANQLSDYISWNTKAITEWKNLDDKISLFKESLELVKDSKEKQKNAEAQTMRCKEIVEQCKNELERAKRAWLWKVKKIKQAELALNAAKNEMVKAERALVEASRSFKESVQISSEFEKDVNKQKGICAGFPKRESITKELQDAEKQLNEIKGTISTLQDNISQLEEKIISEAKVVYCTLTKSFMGRELQKQKFDAVIIDEISMALPPMIFIAAGKAESRVILVGDFLQLPPIIRSDEKISNDRMGRDVFELSRVAINNKPSPNCKALTKLSVQQRMVPEIADIARQLVYLEAGLELKDHPKVKKRGKLDWLDFLPDNPLVIIDTADLNCWSGKQPGSLSRFNFYSGNIAVKLAAMAAQRIEQPDNQIGIVTPFSAQRRMLSRLIKNMELDNWVAAGTVHTFQGSQAELIIFDSVLDEPYYSARLCNPRDRDQVIRDINVAVTRARNKFVFIGSSQWLNKNAKPSSALGQLWEFLKDRADLISADELAINPYQQPTLFSTGWTPPSNEKGPMFKLLDEVSFFDCFIEDINNAKESIFGLAPYFGQYRWPTIEPHIRNALTRGVGVTLVTPPISEAQNQTYVSKVIKNLRSLGAFVITASGLHGKDVIIDEGIVYTGSMNWSSHRGRIEIIHRIQAHDYARICLELLQAKHIRKAAVHDDGSIRVCPYCNMPTHIVNQRRQHGTWDFQALKVGCSNPECKDYLRNIDERPPYKSIPLCKIDGRTKLRRARRGRGEVWQCPKHPKEMEKVVPGDPQ
ncbi:MAG: hypothetical protein JL50_06195 [Peptococcaceae bacterium BICA1-7]|nr:MAG: hypothetical protein JL50_06195 [Peptococcaceae bacterium BICA1-7]HBV96183.1 hypothetical protein [Desulfotomaculum sp.]